MVSKNSLRFVFRSAVVGIVAAILILLLQSVSNKNFLSTLTGLPTTSKSKNVNHTDKLLPLQQPYSYNAAVEIAAPAVVNIYSIQIQEQATHPLFQDPVFRRFFGDAATVPKPKENNNLGSGVILDSAGYVLTNAHVINNADVVTVSLQDGRQTDAKIIGADIDTDLAVLKIDLDKLPVIPIADSSKLRVGDVVLAIGNPYNFGQTVTQGIVSATGRRSLGISTFEDFIQTDASINPGNSGGALVDAYGRLLGINTAIISSTGGSQGIGLATPINLALEVMWQLISNGKVVRGWLGIEAQAIPAELQRQMSLFDGGVLIAGVLQNGPAHNAGLIPGDIITEINGQKIANPQQAIYTIAQFKPGMKITLTVLRAWDKLEIQAMVAQRPQFQS